jgi:alpha/beta superfamily hydrolase
MKCGEYMPFEKIEFPNDAGELLAARLELPEREVQAYAIFAHCLTCTKKIKAAGNISKAMAERGLGVLRFDFTRLGNSEGDFANTNFTSNVQDLLKAAEYLEANYRPPKLLVGHSLGGAAVLRAANDLPEVAAVATIGAPAEPAHVAHLFRSSLEELEANGETEVFIAGRPFTIKKQFLEDIGKTKIESAIHNLGKALMIFHSPIDQVVGIDNAAAIFQAARHPKSFISLDRADHLLADDWDSSYVGRVIGEWARKYVSGLEVEEV